MSEAELHFLKARMRGGQINKARRGELRIGAPVGLVYRLDGALELDPDAEVQAALRLVFSTFERLGSATRTVKYFLDHASSSPAGCAKARKRATFYGRPRSMRASCRS